MQRTLFSSYLLLLLFLGVGLSSCKKAKLQFLASEFESSERDEWQRPDLILRYMGNPEQLAVADIGAATGYFSFRIAETGGRVLALDVDDDWISYLKERKANLKDRATADRITVRKIPTDSPGFSPGEANVALMVNVYHHLNKESRVEYLKKLREALGESGRVFLIDFYDRERPVGPPPGHYLVSPEIAKKELLESGFTIRESIEELPYQYFFIATPVKSYSSN